MNSFSDENLMVRVRTGEVNRLGLLFERHHVRLYNYFLRMLQQPGTSEDLVQEVFFRILKYKHTYKEEVPFVRWMYRIAQNVGYDHFGKKKEEQAPQEEPMGATPDMVGKLSHQLDVGHLKKAFAQLSTEQREVLVLSRYQDMKYNDIAQLTGVSVSAVKVRVHRALKELRTRFFKVAREEAS